ncbi:MAG: carbon-nitrogen hydrolase family protein [Candidatus Hodarchaeota archaeon]
MNKFKIALIQPSVKPYDVQNNLDSLAEKLEQLKNQNVRLAVLPEFFPTGNTLDPELLKVAIQTSEITKNWLLNQSQKLDMIISGSYLSLEEGDVYNKFVIQEPDGQTSAHLKTRCPAPESSSYRVSSESKHIVDTSIGKIGLIICIEMLYNEIIQADYTDCSLILITLAVPDMLSSLGKMMVKIPEALAKKNGVPVVLCSMGGAFQSNGSIFPLKIKLRGLYGGRSGIYLPSGSITDPLLPGKEDILVADIPLGPKVEEPDLSVKIRAKIPIPMQILNLLFKRRGKKIYQSNLKKWC